MFIAVDLLHEYNAFSATHFLVLAALAVGTAVACMLRPGRWAERIAGGAMLGVWMAATIYWLLPAHFTLAVSLPVHMCDLTGLLAPIVLLTRWRLPRALLYFWGLGLSIHGVLTPVLDHGPLHVTFWLYWLVHGSIIGTAVYDVIGRGYRPTVRDLMIATGACAVWLGVVLAINLPLGLNYGYVGNITPEKPTVIDALGPWPLRVYKMIFGVVLLFVMMWLPWAVAGRISRRRGSDRTSSA